MPPIDARLVKAKRFPVHAAVILCNENEMVRLVDPDARFHLGRKMIESESSVLHVACSSRPGPKEVIVRMLKYLVKMEAPLHDLDAAGQTALHYSVCNVDHAIELTSILISAGCDVNARRKIDGWAPIHLATMFGKVEVAKALLRAGADPTIRAELRDLDTVNAEQMAKKLGLYYLADIISSPRAEHRPESEELADSSVFGDVVRKVHSEWDPSKPLPTPVKFKEDVLAWRDAKGNSMLHLVAWNGDVKLARAIFDNVKARKLTTTLNSDGATPLALAMIAGEDAMVEEFFQNKHSKKLIEFHIQLKTTGQNLLHLMLQYSPTVPPKFMLKRKDLTKETLNSVDDRGDSPLLMCARRNSRQSMYRVFVSKNVKDHQMLDLSLRNKEFRDVLFYLIHHGDLTNFRQMLDREELTKEITARTFFNEESPLAMCLRMGKIDFVREIMLHQTAKDKFNFTQGSGQPGLLHLLACRSDADDLWDLALQREDCNINDADTDGNTPIMKAVACGRHKLAERCLESPVLLRQIDPNVKNKESNTLLHLCVQQEGNRNMDAMVKTLLQRLDVKTSVNVVNGEGETALLKASRLERWPTVKTLLESDRVNNEVDVHVANSAGNTCLVVIMLARIKLARQEQTFTMKKEKIQATKAHLEFESLWELIKLVLVREKGMHGQTMVQGRDGGSDCLKKQMAASKLIRTPTPEEVVSAFAKQYQVLKAKKKPISRQTSVAEEDSKKTVANGGLDGGVLGEIMGKANKKMGEEKRAAEEAVSKRIVAMRKQKQEEVEKAAQEQGQEQHNAITSASEELLKNGDEATEATPMKKKKLVVKKKEANAEDDNAKATDNTSSKVGSESSVETVVEKEEVTGILASNIFSKNSSNVSTPVKYIEPLTEEHSITDATVQPESKKTIPSSTNTLSVEEEVGMERVPTPTPRRRRLRSPAPPLGGKTTLNGKPPIPDGHSNPPPEDEENRSYNSNGTSPPPTSSGFGCEDKSEMVAEKANACTQTEEALFETRGVQTIRTRCCCTCGQQQPSGMS